MFLHYDFLAEDTLNELIKNRCRNKTDIIPIYAKLYETYHLKNSHKLAFKYFDKLIDEINNLKIEDKIQFKYMDTPMGTFTIKIGTIINIYLLGISIFHLNVISNMINLD